MNLRLAVVVLTFAAPLAAQQALDRFSTGPLVGWDPADIRPSQATPGDAVPPSPVDATDVRANSVTGNAQNETSLAVSHVDPLFWVGAANSYQTGTVQTAWYVTHDGGKTWTSGVFPIQAGFSFSGDPAVCFDAAGNPVIVCMMYSGPGGSRVASFRSTNGGSTWAGPINVNLDPANDKPQVETDLSGGPFHGRIAVAWDRFGTVGGDHIYTSFSNDGGQTWSVPVRANGNGSVTTIGPDVAWGAGSVLYVMWEDRGLDDIYVDRSLDGGTTWGTDRKVADFTTVPSPIPGSSFRMFEVGAISADDTAGPYSGRVYVTWHNWVSGADPHADIRMSTSSDQGQTWTPSVVVNAGDTTRADQVFPGIVADRKGNVNLVYYDRRLDPNNFLLWTWVARSSDGGATFREVRASDVGWNHFPTEFGGTFIGDYHDLDQTPSGVAPFWCDGRSGTQDVYVDSLNLDLSSDVNGIQASTGGGVTFLVNVGPNHGGKTYVLVATGSGTSPGSTVNGVHVPINFDFWTNLSITLFNTAVFPNSLGTLDATGSTFPGFNTLGPFNPALAGTNLDWCLVVLDAANQVVYASAPTRVALVP
ncbi:MAG: exo-alpha-sialidase [Planctomycetes bacterium]|nr:exo-alpha-sialidase [Planctomycetota bacterium]